MTHYMSSRELQTFRENIHRLQKRYLPAGATMSITGTTTLWANMDTQVSQTQFVSLLFITIFMAIFLPLIFGSIRLGLTGLLVNVIPLAVTLGCMSLLGIKINMATALIGGISLGLIVDDTIHFICRVIHNKQNGAATGQAVDEAARTIGNSIIRTSLILVIGFSCMATSQFLPTAHFGIFISLAIVLALFLDLICLPAVLKAFPQLVQKTIIYRWVKL
jgi:predicted RND superfamily exporter protein